MRYLNRAFASALLTVLVSTPTVHAHTQSDGFALGRFDPADRGSDWFVLESPDWNGRLRPSIGLTADFAHRPLVIYDAETEESMTVLVENQFFMHVGGALAVADRLRFGVSLPV